jgi:hypothetical protein
VLSGIAPGARVLATDLNLYDPRLEPEAASLQPVVDAAREFDPDILVIAPYQWTALEERLSNDLPRARVVAMSGRRFFDVNYGPGPVLTRPRITDLVQVAEDAPELRKNELLAAAVLGRAVKLPPPHLVAGPEHLAAASAALARLGFEPGSYAIACVGDSQWTRVRNWRPERWGEVLGEWSRRHGRRFILVGHESEQETSELVRRGMGESATNAVLWSGRGDGDLDVLLGLIAQSGGYIGRDTGPMHLAAALGKPVIAVFGGGTWPRFIPAALSGAAIMVGVPCVGCNWVCHLPESYCIKEVPAGEVLRAIDELEAGTLREMSVRALPPGPALIARIAREGAEAARLSLTQLSGTRNQDMEQTLERALRDAGKADLLEKQLEEARAEMTRRESLLKQRVVATENMFRARHEELDRRAEGFDEEVRRARDAAEAEFRRQLTGAEAEHHRREAELRAALARAQAEVEQVRLEIGDARLKLQTAYEQHQALRALGAQQAEEIGLLRARVRDLVVSRWRRAGQRVHLCMTLPWEREYVNGSH